MSRANKKKPGMPNVANDLSQKLYATMEKHKEVGLNSLSFGENTISSPVLTSKCLFFFYLIKSRSSL